MAIPITLEDPILVVVEGNAWYALPLHSEPTERDAELLFELARMGGVSKTVEPGRYYFNVIEFTEKLTIASLEPAPI